MTMRDHDAKHTYRRGARRAALLALLPAACLLATATPADAQTRGRDGKTVYCWNDASGKRVCGDALPPEATDRARTEINAATGMRRRQLQRVPTEAERAAAAQEAEAAARQAAIEAAQLRKELAMVESYANEDELRRAYRNRIEMMDGAIESSRAGAANLRLGLVALLRQAGELELAGKPVPASLAAGIADRHETLGRQQSILDAQVRERATLDVEFENAVRRYRELKRPAGPAAGAARRQLAAGSPG